MYLVPKYTLYCSMFGNKPNTFCNHLKIISGNCRAIAYSITAPTIYVMPSACAGNERVAGEKLARGRTRSHIAPSASWLKMICWKPSQDIIIRNYLRLPSIRILIRLQAANCSVKSAKTSQIWLSTRPFSAVCRLLYSEDCNSQWIMPTHQYQWPMRLHLCDIYSRVIKASGKWWSFDKKSFIKIMWSGPYSHPAFEALFVLTATCHHKYQHCTFWT